MISHLSRKFLQLAWLLATCCITSTVRFQDLHAQVEPSSNSLIYHPFLDPIEQQQLGNPVVMVDLTTFTERFVSLNVPVVDPTSFTWSNDGQFIYFTAGKDSFGDVFRVGVDGTHLQRFGYDYRREYHLAESPDGSQIAFVNGRYNPETNNVYLLNTSDFGVRQITFDIPVWGQLSWMPNGKQLLFVGQQMNNIYRCESDIFLIDIQTGEVNQLTDGLGLNTWPMSINSGNQVSFLSDRSGKNQIYTVDIVSEEIKQITTQFNSVDTNFLAHG